MTEAGEKSSTLPRRYFLKLGAGVVAGGVAGALAALARGYFNAGKQPEPPKPILTATKNPIETPPLPVVELTPEDIFGQDISRRHLTPTYDGKPPVLNYEYGFYFKGNFLPPMYWPTDFGACDFCELISACGNGTYSFLEIVIKPVDDDRPPADTLIIAVNKITLGEIDGNYHRILIPLNQQADWKKDLVSRGCQAGNVIWDAPPGLREVDNIRIIFQRGKQQGNYLFWREIPPPEELPDSA